MRMENARMEADEEQSVWTSEKFLDMRKQFLEARTEVAAFDVLQRLAAIQEDEVDENAWLDCKDLMILLLETIPVEVMFLRQQLVLLHAIEHSPAHVISALAEFYAGKSETPALMRQQAVAVAVAFARRINETETFEAISKLLAPVCGQAEVKGEFLHQLNASRSGEEHRFRIYQVLIEAIRQRCFSNDLLPILEHVVSDLNNSSDVLSQLAALDFLADFAIVSKEAAEVLAGAGVVDRIHAMLSSSKSAPDGGFLFSACVKFFGCLAHCYAEVIDRYQDFVSAVTNMVLNYNSLDASQRLLAVETFAHLAYTPEAKRKLHEKAEDYGIPGSLYEMGNAARTGPVELRVRVVEAISTLFEQGDEQLLATWLQQMPSLPEILSAYVVKPFADMRKTAIRAISVLMSRSAGVVAMMSSRDNVEQFKEWLCDPHSETEWECAQLKNDLVRQFRSADWPVVDGVLKDKMKFYFDAPKAAPQVATLEL